MDKLPVHLVVAQVVCGGLLVELVSSELIGLLGLSDIPLLIGKELMGTLVVKVLIGKLEGNCLGQVVGKFVGKELAGKELVGTELMGKELMGKELGSKLVGKEVVGKFLGKERVGKRAPQLQLGLSLRLLLRNNQLSQHKSTVFELITLFELKDGDI